MRPSGILDTTARACSSCGKMILLRQVRAYYLQTYEEFPVVDRVRMPNCIDESTLEREYEVRHENWEVLLVTHAKSRIQGCSQWAFLNLEKYQVRLECRVAFTYFFTNFSHGLRNI